MRVRVNLENGAARGGGPCPVAALVQLSSAEAFSANMRLCGFILLFLLTCTCTVSTRTRSRRSPHGSKHKSHHRPLTDEQKADQNLQFMLSLYRSAAGPDGRPKQHRKFNSNTVRLLRPTASSLRYLPATRDHHYSFTVQYNLDTLPSEQLVKASFIHLRSPSGGSSGTPQAPRCRAQLSTLGQKSLVVLEPEERWTETDITAHVLQDLSSHLTLTAQYWCSDAGHDQVAQPWWSWFSWGPRHKEEPQPQVEVPSLLLYLQENRQVNDWMGELLGQDVGHDFVDQIRHGHDFVDQIRHGHDFVDQIRHGHDFVNQIRPRRLFGNQIRQGHQLRHRKDVENQAERRQDDVLRFVNGSRYRKDARDFVNISKHGGDSHDFVNGSENGRAAHDFANGQKEHDFVNESKDERSAHDFVNQNRNGGNSHDFESRHVLQRQKRSETENAAQTLDILTETSPTTSSSTSSFSSFLSDLPNYKRKTGTPKNRCKLHSFRLSFDRLGWGHYFIAPPMYNPRFCRGDCPRVLPYGYNSPNHAVIQNTIHELGLGTYPCRPACLTNICLLAFWSCTKTRWNTGNWKIWSLNRARADRTTCDQPKT
ncbi:hypothetical protein WMY93_015177 [Mugilogobius chulae]|uniref:TGF-beta family profile domain-containing protein n=1 Tax=Mugilogobius chulae TaxID=88201 RepID=A0AAW0P1D3_9GOBI